MPIRRRPPRLPAATPGEADSKKAKLGQWVRLHHYNITRLNELFITDGPMDQDIINRAYTIRDRVRENEPVTLKPLDPRVQSATG